MRQTVSLLSAPAHPSIHRQRDALNERSIRAHDAVIVVVHGIDPGARTPAVLEALPGAAVWQRLYREALARGPVMSLHAGITADAVPTILMFSKQNASAFERLTQAGRIWKTLAANPPRRLLVAVIPSAGNEEALHALAEAVIAAALAAAAPMPVIKSKPTALQPLELITLCGAGAHLDLQRTIAIDHGNHLARWLSALPPNVLNSTSYRRAINSLARRCGWSFTFLDEKSLQRLGAGAFLAVSRANDHRDAGIVRLRHRARDRRKVRAHIALIGKGICFDTGGINLKGHKSMYLMHEDMQGSAVALGTLLALTELDAPFDIDCWLALTENETGARAFRPQEVVTASNGVTIQVAHSDAEGRMVLADTLALAAREKPALMLDFATLTGACVTALTERFSGAFSNRAEFRDAIEAAGRASGERVWSFPMDEDFDRDLDSPIADILQCTPDSKGDHILAARFLNRFVPAEIPWIHLDLASSNRSGGLAHIPTDCTGFGVRYATSLLLDGGLFAANTKIAKKAAGKLGTGPARFASRHKMARSK